MKRKILFIICLTIVSLQIKAQLSYLNVPNTLITKNETLYNDNLLQSVNSKKEQERKFYIGLISSLDFYNFKFNTSLFADQTQVAVNDYPGFNVGIKVQYDFNNKFSLRSGISFSEIKYKTTFSNTSDPITAYDNYTINYINIPLMAGYTVFSKGNFKLTPSAGCIISSMLEMKTIQTMLDGSSYSQTQYSTFSPKIKQIQLNIGCEYLLNNKFLITLEPYLNYRFNDTKNDIIYNTYIYGGILSVNYKL